MAKRAILAMAIAVFAVAFIAGAMASGWYVSAGYSTSDYAYPTAVYYPSATSVYAPGYNYYYEYYPYPAAYSYFPYGYSYYYPNWRSLPAGPSYGNIARAIYDPTYPSVTGTFTSYNSGSAYSSYSSPPTARYPAYATYSSRVCAYTTGC
ncbi:MAG: hypothetical protein HYW05_01675 [Candidatus Diapherotrites archaeon]|nr:hypothetical protein [Candidatus Diapherotrites archaeon]